MNELRYNINELEDAIQKAKALNEEIESSAAKLNEAIESVKPVLDAAERVNDAMNRMKIKSDMMCLRMLSEIFGIDDVIGQ